MTPGHPSARLSSDLRTVLCCLVAGADLRAVSASLHLSPRTVDRRVADLKRLLLAPQPLCLGARAVRLGWVEPAHPICHAVARRRGNPFVPPSTRQSDVVRLLASGVGPAGVAVEIGISPRTVRQEVSRLAAVNGARSLVHAGALFRALGWI